MTSAEHGREDVAATPVLTPWGLELLLALVVVVLLPHAYQPDVVKSPLLVAGTVLLFSLCVFSITRGRVVAYPPPSVTIPVLLLCLLAMGRSVFTPVTAGAREAALLWSAFGLCFFFGCMGFTSERDVGRFFTSLSLIALLVSVLGVLQLTSSGTAGLVFMIGNNGRIPSTLGNPSVLAGFTAGLLPMTLVCAWHAAGLKRILHASAAIGLVFLAIASGSRGGMAATCGGLAGLVLLTRRTIGNGRQRAVWILSGATLFVLLLLPLREVFLAIEFPEKGVSLARRLVIWESATKAFLSAPWIGHGTGSFITVLPFFRDPLYWQNGTEDLVPHAHNEILELGAEFGITGVVLWAIIVVTALRGGIRNSRKRNGREMTAAAVTAGVLGILLDNLTGISLRHPPVGALAWILMGMLSSAFMSGTSPVVLRRGGGFQRGLGLIILAAAVVWSGYYFSRQVPRFDSERHMLDGIMAGARGDAETAARELLEASRVDPGNLQALSAAAPVWLLRGDPARALKVVDALLERAPFFPRSHLVRAQALFMLGRTAEASTALARELRLRRHPETLLFQSRMALITGDSLAARTAEAEARLLEGGRSAGEK